MSGYLKDYRLRIGFAGIALLAVPAVAWFYNNLPRASLPAGPAARTIAGSHPDASAQGLRFHPKSGHRYTYGFERKIVVHGLQNAPEIAFQGELSLDILNSDESGFDAIAREQITSLRNPDPVALRVHIDATGENIQIQGAAAQNDNERQHEAILKDLVLNWTFPLQSDTVGRYRAQFETLPNDGALIRIRKTKISYINAPKPEPQIVSSVHELRWDPESAVPNEIFGMESTRLGEGPLGLSSDSSYRIRFLNLTAGIDASAKTLASLNVREDSALNRGDRMSEHPEFASLSWPVVSKRLLMLNQLNSGEQLKAFGDLVRLMKMNGETISDALALLKSQGVLPLGAQSDLFKTVVGALATVGTAQAQAAVLGIYQDPECPISGKGTILAALTTTQAPLMADTRAFLAGEMQNETNSDLAHGAGFALGASLQNAPNDAQTAQAIQQVQNAWNAEGANGNEGERLDLLDDMGNSGRSEYLPQIQGVIANNDEDSTMRAKAVFALRYMSDDGAINTLDQSLSNPDPLIRQAAAQAMNIAPWNSSFMGPLKSCASSETVGAIQTSCRQALQNHTTQASN